MRSLNPPYGIIYHNTSVNGNQTVEQNGSCRESLVKRKDLVKVMQRLRNTEIQRCRGIQGDRR